MSNKRISSTPRKDRSSRHSSVSRPKNSSRRVTRRSAAVRGRRPVRRKRGSLTPLLICLTVLLALTAVIIVSTVVNRLLHPAGGDLTLQTVQTLQPTQVPATLAPTEAPSAAPTVTPEPTETPVAVTVPPAETVPPRTPEPVVLPPSDPKIPIFPNGQKPGTVALGTSPLQNAVADPTRAKYRPAPRAEGWLPVFTSSKTDEKIICITVDDCYQVENLRTIVGMTIQLGGKLTIFPIGENIAKCGDILYEAGAKYGFEIENHTMTHNSLYQCSDEELAWEVFSQNAALNKQFNVNYQVHFLRPRGGDARYDQRIHTYADQLGYYGIAHWSVSGSDSSMEEIGASLKPGQIYLFHTTDADLAKLQAFLPYAVSRGYQLVTMNEMFGYPRNEFTEPVSLTNADIVPLRYFEYLPMTVKKGSYSRLVQLIQNRLCVLGYLSSLGDGDYGSNTEAAVRAFQLNAGLQVTGICDEETERALFANSAPRSDTPVA